MKNITVSVEDEVYHRARVSAAEQRTSVSALVKRFLEEVAGEETGQDRMRRLENETMERIRERGGIYAAGERLTRDEVHERKTIH